MSAFDGSLKNAESGHSHNVVVMGMGDIHVHGVRPGFSKGSKEVRASAAANAAAAPQQQAEPPHDQQLAQSVAATVNAATARQPQPPHDQQLSQCMEELATTLAQQLAQQVQQQLVRELTKVLASATPPAPPRAPGGGDVILPFAVPEAPCWGKHIKEPTQGRKRKRLSSGVSF